MEMCSIFCFILIVTIIVGIAYILYKEFYPELFGSYSVLPYYGINGAYGTHALRGSYGPYGYTKGPCENVTSSIFDVGFYESDPRIQTTNSYGLSGKCCPNGYNGKKLRMHYDKPGMA